MGDEAEVALLLPSAHTLAQESPSGFSASSELAFPRSCCNPDTLFLNKVRIPGDVERGPPPAHWDAVGSPGLFQHPKTMNPGLCRLLLGWVFVLLRLSPLPAQERALGSSSVCKGLGGTHPIPGSGRSALLHASFSTPCSPQVACPRCEGAAELYQQVSPSPTVSGAAMLSLEGRCYREITLLSHSQQPICPRAETRQTHLYPLGKVLGRAMCAARPRCCLPPI